MPPPLEGLSPEAEKEAHRELFEARVAEHLATAQGNNSQFLTLERYEQIKRDLAVWGQASDDEKRLIRQNNTRIYHQNKQYEVLLIGGESVLVRRPTEAQTAAGALPADQRLVVSHQARAFDDMYTIHKNGHHKSRAFRNLVQAKYGHSIPQWCFEALTDTCPTCVRQLKRSVKGTAGHCPIITRGYGTRGQVSLLGGVSGGWLGWAGDGRAGRGRAGGWQAASPRCGGGRSRRTGMR